MAGILHNVFSKGIYTLKDPDNVSKIKTLVNHSALYFGLIVYTAIGAKVSYHILIYIVPRIIIFIPANSQKIDACFEIKMLLLVDRR